MRKMILILGFILVAFGVSAQEKSNVKRNDLKGPAFKNYKPWKHKTAPRTLYVSNKRKGLTGPAYKNYKPWKDTSKEILTAVNTSGTERQKLTGPAYKNYKPWKKKKK